ncbi:hypothetical protein BGZ80_006184 [Entomortierella chlamydospora]|uniref:PUM-HD domain-containing protein n=1 Tax=Entomortierella chlamydospora TaxID=101097 RepID=A0A9P6MZ11_9FUNG|nr:hypothetical protein BGZ80_006184 [Entomortierella chlamydospora]
MLGNWYKERLVNAQSNVNSLLLNHSKQSTNASISVQQQPFAEDNEPDVESLFKNSFPTKPANSTIVISINNVNNAITLPPVPIPVLESNSSSRHSFQRHQDQPPQQRVSRSLNPTVILGRLLDPSPELESPLSEPSSIGVPVSNSPGIEEMALMTIGQNGNANTTNLATASSVSLEAVMTIQRAVRRFLVRKQAEINKQPALKLSAPKVVLEINTSTAANNGNKFDIKALQQTCLRQSEEINQLKEIVTKLLLEAEEDRRRLHQKDREIEELVKQQKLSRSSGLDALSSAKAAPRLNNNNNNNNNNALGLSGSTVASSSTTSSFNSFSLQSLAGSRDDSSAGLEHHLTGNALGIPVDDSYEPIVSYSSNIGGPSLHPLSLPSRSNSITSLQSQQPQQSSVHQGLSLKINASQSFYNQQYQGLIEMVDSPSSSEFGSDITTSSGFGAGSRGLAGTHGYGSQSSFPLLSHRSSGSFSSTSRTFDSPTIEQQFAYPWNVPGSLSHSHSWADDMTYGHDSNVPSLDQFQHGGMSCSAGYDPNFINQQYTHGSQQHQGLPQHRKSHRRHSEKSAHLDYQMCVDRILQATDQQASIHLQQKLKTSPPEQKIEIIDTILGQAYPLMSNRFGNFLIQRCFEFGSPQQIEALAQAMRGNILTLACDPFGCHVVQKALDNVEEDCKARIVTEMFRKIRETIVHRYACHVWQKVFEIRWTDAPPAVMTYVNNAVAGRWASVAMDETGSLVVQNIFENCAEHDKRQALNEILQFVTTIAKGQWGNWVIQHILEHGAPADRATVTQKILEHAVSLSLDQYASKVVEKALRTAAIPAHVSTLTGAEKNDGNGNNKSMSDEANGANVGPLTLTVNGTTIRLTQEDVESQYIHIICDGVQDRPRIPLIDIAADQYGNYIVQYILTNAGPQHRETCATLIKRHMVSLRGSKYGQKVAFMVERRRGNPFSGNGNNGNGNGGNSSGQRGVPSYGSKSGSGSGSDGNGGNGGNGGGGRRRW